MTMRQTLAEIFGPGAFLRSLHSKMSMLLLDHQVIFFKANNPVGTPFYPIEFQLLASLPRTVLAAFSVASEPLSPPLILFLFVIPYELVQRPFFVNLPKTTGYLIGDIITHRLFRIDAKDLTHISLKLADIDFVI